MYMIPPCFVFKNKKEPHGKLPCGSFYALLKYKKGHKCPLLREFY